VLDRKASLLKKGHIAWIDLARSFSIFCVVLIHTLEITDSMTLDYMSGAGLRTKVCAFTLFTIGRLGVPIFLFISGYLLLDREYDGKACVKFWKKNWLGLLLTTEIWIVIYNLFQSWFIQQPIHLPDLLKNMFFVKTMDQPVDFTHMWYMRMILGVYIFIPFVAIVLKKIDMKTLRMPLSITFCYYFILPVMNVVLNACGRETISNLLGLEFSGGVYGLLLMFGFFCKKGVLKQIRSIHLLLTGAICFVLTVGLQLFSYHHQKEYNLWYSCAFLMITCLCIFELMSRREHLCFPKLCGSLSRCAFGIYLVHKPLLLLADRWFDLQLASPTIVVVAVLVLCSSWGIVAIVSRIPRLGQILFFIN
jgi:surface polysaccharide O-acyltransferase-like enzyme